VDAIWRKLYDDLIESVDAMDNGIDQYPSHVIPFFRQTTHLT
jgi:uncharacterized UPF0160 family protein